MFYFFSFFLFLDFCQNKHFNCVESKKCWQSDRSIDHRGRKANQSFHASSPACYSKSNRINRCRSSDAKVAIFERSFQSKIVVLFLILNLQTANISCFVTLFYLDYKFLLLFLWFESICLSSSSHSHLCLLVDSTIVFVSKSTFVNWINFVFVLKIEKINKNKQKKKREKKKFTITSCTLRPYDCKASGKSIVCLWYQIVCLVEFEFILI